MPYIQSWGISRLSAVSPLNNNGAKSIMDPNYEEEPKQTFGFEVDTNPDLDADNDIITQNNDVAEYKTQSEHGMSDSENNIEAGSTTPEFPINGSNEEKKEWYRKYHKGPSLSQEKADHVASQFKRQKEGDSFWDQVGTFLSNPFQGTIALGNQVTQGLRDITGNPTNISQRNDSLANLTNLAMAKEYEGKSGVIHPDLAKSNMFNNATQWQPHLVAASSAHQVLTGGDQVLSGDFKEGGKNIVGGAFSYLPGVKQMKKMGGTGGVTSKLDKMTGPMMANIAPTVNRVTTNLANKIDANTTSRIASAVLDKGGTYSYKINKAKKQGTMKAS